MRYANYNIVLFSIKMAWKYVKEVNNSIWQHSAVLRPDVSKQLISGREWIDISKCTIMWKMHFCMIITIWSFTSLIGMCHTALIDCENHAKRNGRPMPSILFPKHQCCILPLCSFCPKFPYYCVAQFPIYSWSQCDLYMVTLVTTVACKSTRTNSQSSLNNSMWSGRMLTTWASYQIRKIEVCACAGNAGNVFPPPISKEIAN